MPRPINTIHPNVLCFLCFMLSWLVPCARGFLTTTTSTRQLAARRIRLFSTKEKVIPKSNMTPQHQQPLDNDNDHDNDSHSTMARKVSPTQLAECGARLRAGELVAFPTETVYGLGCHALDQSAVQKVFAAKERPLTDPLIVHVAQAPDALQLWVQDDKIMLSILETICDQFWPGPLTLVAKAAPHVPSILMANTGYVACRCPLHPLAQQLIREARVPIAAPSANKFGHVSPTQADHVMDDLGQENVWVLEEDMSSSNANAVACPVGVESTVAKLEVVTTPNAPHSYALTVLRQGAVAVQDLKECLTKAGRIEDVSVASLSDRTVEETEATVAPGQTIKHYSPRIPSFLLAPSLSNTCMDNDDTMKSFLQQSIVLDFGGRLAGKKDVARRYRDLSPSGDSTQAAQCVFEALRWAERIDPEAQWIVFPQVVVDGGNYDALALALNDRLTRAASGVVLDSLESIEAHAPSIR